MRTLRGTLSVFGLGLGLVLLLGGCTVSKAIPKPTTDTTIHECDATPNCGQCVSNGRCGWCAATNKCIDVNQAVACPSPDKWIPRDPDQTLCPPDAPGANTGTKF